ncbi:hypothetical protein [Brachybacterium tyrofermentans]|uniref:hypothetical protein n=1 Tax=Brachybacterium tyrofermentans TaxID=47848 RepID=UPI003F8E6A79
MTQGYGPNNGQQPQWGQGNQNPQQPAQPQWQQAPQAQSPAQPQWQQAPAGYASPAPSYPGAPGSGGPAAYGAANDPSKRGLARKLGIALLVLSVIALIARLVTPIFMFIVAGSGNPAEMETVSVGMGLSSLGTILSWIVNLIVSLALLVIAIIGAIQFSQRGRIGASIVIATVVLSVPLYWIVSFLAGFIAALATGAADPSSTYVVGGIAEIVRLLIVGATLLVGSYLVLAWGRRTNS